VRARVFFQKKVRSIKSAFCFLYLSILEKEGAGREIYPAAGKKEVPFPRGEIG